MNAAPTMCLDQGNKFDTACIRPQQVKSTIDVRLRRQMLKHPAPFFGRKGAEARSNLPENVSRYQYSTIQIDLSLCRFVDTPPTHVSGDIGLD